MTELRQANQQDPRVLYLTAVALSNTYGYVRGKAKAMLTMPKKD